MKKLSWVSVATVAVLTGCTLPPAPVPGPTGSSATTGSAGATGSASATPSAPVTQTPEQALDAVRAGLVAPKEIASAPIVAANELKGGTFRVYEVRSAEGSTRLLWSVTHPSLMAKAASLEMYGNKESRTNFPSLVAGDQAWAPSEVRQTLSGDGWYPFAPVTAQAIAQDERITYASYPALPNGVNEVEVRSALLAKPLKAKVERGAESAPASTSELPVLGRVLLNKLGSRGNEVDLVMALHGVRRVNGGTVVYYSVALPEGAAKASLDTGYFTEVLNRSALGGEKLGRMVAVVDRPSKKALTQIGAPSAKQGCSDLGGVTLQPADAVVCPAVLPPLPASTNKVDVELGGRALFQDVPVEEGPLSPQSDRTVEGSKDAVRLGTGWPSLPEAAFTKVKDPASVAAATTDVRDVVTEAGVTDDGKQLDLNTSVLFEYNKATLTPAASVALDKAVAIIGKSKPGKLKVVGHTDSDGEDAYNVELSRKRAQAVADALKPKLGAGWSFAVEGKGEAEPVATNSTEIGKQANRRVTITIPE